MLLYAPLPYTSSASGSNKADPYYTYNQTLIYLQTALRFPINYSLFCMSRSTIFGGFRYGSSAQCSYLFSHSLEQRHVLLNGKLQGALG